MLPGLLRFPLGIPVSSQKTCMFQSAVQQLNVSRLDVLQSVHTSPSSLESCRHVLVGMLTPEFSQVDKNEGRDAGHEHKLQRMSDKQNELPKDRSSNNT